MMGRCTAWKFLVPPKGFLSAVLVDAVSAQRFTNEDPYNAKLIERQMTRANGRGWMVLDKTIHDEIRADAENPDNDLYPFQRMQALVTMEGAVQADSLAALARVCRLPAAQLEQTIAKYNVDARTGGDTNFGKLQKYLRPLETGPFYAVWVDATVPPLQRRILKATPITAITLAKRLPQWALRLVVRLAVRSGMPFPPTPTFSLGGLHTDLDQRVLREGLTPIPGLYAAGRSAAGVASGGYVSGLSIADAVYSGRRAGRHAAAALHGEDRMHGEFLQLLEEQGSFAIPSSKL